MSNTEKELMATNVAMVKIQNGPRATIEMLPNKAFKIHLEDLSVTDIKSLGEIIDLLQETAKFLAAQSDED